MPVLPFHNRNLIVGQAVELVNEWSNLRFISKCSGELLWQRLLKSQNRIYESELAIIIKQDIVAILSDICHKHIIIGKDISPIWS